MRPRAVIAVVIAALALSAAPAEAAKPHDACHPRRARTAAQNSTLRVFRVGDALYACKKGGAHPISLGEPALPCSEQSSTSGCDGVSAIRVKRRFVAVAWFAEGSDSLAAWVDVFDVVKRRRVSRWESPRHSRDEGSGWFADVTDILLAPSGVVGMIVSEGRSSESSGYWRTHKVLTLRRGKRTLLDDSDEIQAGSLKLAQDGTLSWKHGDTVRSAPLE
jgi:hypothetical protein